MKKPEKGRPTEGAPMHPESLMMSYGYDPARSEGAVKCPIFQTSTFVFRTAEEGKAFFQVAYGLREPEPGEEQGLIYSRLNNPDLEILEDRLTLWDGAEAAAVFGSGMAAISTSLLELLGPGDVVLYSEPIYGGTYFLFNHILPRYGIEAVPFAAGDAPALAADSLSEDQKSRLAMIFAETPANPTNALVDIRACADVAAELGRPERKVLVAVDNTFLGPLWQHPLQQGADLVIYSATKYIGGHSDLIAGVCLGSKALMTRIKVMRTIMGAMAGPWTGWLLMRSLETLKLRMTRQSESAHHVADFLSRHERVKKVYYLGHLQESDPQYDIYRRQCLSAGGMMAFDIAGGEAEAFRFLNALKLFKLAVSLGGTESLAEHPASMTHSDVEPEERARRSVSDGMVRLSIGVEHPDDLIRDLEQAFSAV